MFNEAKDEINDTSSLCCVYLLIFCSVKFAQLPAGSVVAGLTC